MKIIQRRSQWAVLSLLILSITPSAWADSVVPVERLRSHLQGRTQVPIFVPQALPVRDTLYSIVASTTPDGYGVSFSYTPDCQATACNWGYFSARRGESLTNEPYHARETVERIKLANGIEGRFINSCGAYCTARAEWQSQGVLYSMEIKNGRREDAIAAANSALQGGAISPSAQAGGRLSIGSTARLTSQDAGSRINIRDAASVRAYARHYGFAGDRVRVLAHAKDSDGYSWYQIQFIESDATGWVRSDFITR